MPSTFYTRLAPAFRRSIARFSAPYTPASASALPRHTTQLRMASTLPRLPIFEAVANHDRNATAVIHSVSGRSFTYGRLLGDVGQARDRLLAARGKADMDGERIAFLVENSYDYVVTLLAAMAARCIAVPLSPAFPVSELQYVLNQSGASLLVSSSKFRSKANEVLATGLESPPTYLQLEKHVAESPVEDFSLEKIERPGGAGLMLYTSGTTNRPVRRCLAPGSLY